MCKPAMLSKGCHTTPESLMLTSKGVTTTRRRSFTPSLEGLCLRLRLESHGASASRTFWMLSTT
jgi:hypothetical protein